jgi:hypothetical protein
VRREAASRVTIYCWYQRQCGAAGVHLGQCQGEGGEGYGNISQENVHFDVDGDGKVTVFLFTQVPPQVCSRITHSAF